MIRGRNVVIASLLFVCAGIVVMVVTARKFDGSTQVSPPPDVVQQFSRPELRVSIPEDESRIEVSNIEDSDNPETTQQTKERKEAQRSFVHRELENGYYQSGLLVDGRKEGVWFTTDPEGLILEEVPYKAGSIDGTMIIYGPNGLRLSEADYKDGIGNGKTRGWHSNGQMAFEIDVKDGAYNGAWLEWYANGQAKREAHCVNGKLNGECIFYNEDGSLNLVDSGIYENGKRVAGL